MKVTKKVYTDIKRTIRTLNEEGRIPTHKERRRSRKRKDMYTELGKWHGLSYDTVHAIGQSKSFSDYHVVCSKYKTKKVPVVMKSSQQSKPTDVTVKVQFATKYELDRVYHHMQELLTELDKLHSEMAIIKAKKGRWFHNA